MKIIRRCKGSYCTEDGKYAIVKLEKSQKSKWGIFVYKEYKDNIDMYSPLVVGVETLELAKKSLLKFIEENDKEYIENI